MRVVFALLLLIAPAVAAAQYEDEFATGVLGEYSAGGKSIERIDPEIAFDWSDGSPDQRLAAGPFEVRWQSLLLVREPSDYRFHAWLAGAVTVKLDGQTVLASRRDEAGWVSGEPVELDFGEKSLDVSFEKTGPAAAVKLYWSSDRFPLEPIPSHVLFREEPRDDLSLIERGEAEFRGARCNRCHRREHDPLSQPAPALTHFGDGLTAEWLAAKVREPHKVSAHSRMPTFGFTKPEARAIAAFLLSTTESPKLQSLPEPEKDRETKEPVDGETETRRGEVLFRSLGCLACHTSGKYGDDSPHGGGDLTGVGGKRTEVWLYTWLANPESLNPDHRMPVFKLTKQERRQLAVYLSQQIGDAESDPVEQPPADEDATDASLVSQGRELVTAARCAACHRIPGIDEDVAGLADLSEPIRDVQNTCLAEEPTGNKRRPAYDQLDREAVQAFLNSWTGRLSPENRFARGRRVLVERNCLSCHERDGSRGIAPLAARMANVDKQLQGQSEGLIPPALTAVGDKLRDQALAKAVSGEQDRVRLPWLHVRMPRFDHTADDKRALLHYLTAHDRIPDDPPASLATVSTAEIDESQTLVAGHSLVGVKGFGCIACHGIGTYRPKNVALGTRGSDLARLGETMRKEYYLRWTRSPLRIVPGMEMPSYEKPVPGILDENVDRQLSVTWEALNNPRFHPPTNPSVVEQFFVVQPGEPPRIVRDVFTNPKSNGGGSIARALAVGFDNGHSVLFDLDRFGLSQWTLGDFARQRTEGKSWFWDMAGVHIVSGIGQHSDFALLAGSGTNQGTIFEPTTEEGTNGRLLDYEQSGGAVRFRYELDFNLDGKPHTLTITETLTALPTNVDGELEGAASADDEKSTGRQAASGTPAETETQDPVGTPSKTETENQGATGGSSARAASPQRAGSGEQGPDDTDEKSAVPASDAPRTGWRREIAVENIPAGFDLLVRKMQPAASIGSAAINIIEPTDAETLQVGSEDIKPVGDAYFRIPPDDHRAHSRLDYTTALRSPPLNVLERPTPVADAQAITSVPGFDGVQLPLKTSIMPTAISFTADGKLAFTSLKGNVYTAHDRDGDGVQDELLVFEEGLAAPYGILGDGDDLLVSHKPELLRLRDIDGDGRADRRTVVATGWGYTDNYHDWTCGIVRDSENHLYVGLGSDYAQSKRPADKAKWRGAVLRIDTDGTIEPIGYSLRYPTGLAIDEHDRVYASDNQGVQNAFNEINHVTGGRHYGVPSRYEKNRDASAAPPAIKVPHPWTRSVNGLVMLPSSFPVESLRGHGIGCEYNGRLLIRFTVEEVDGEVQGATYYFSRPDVDNDDENFLGPLCAAVSPDGDMYVGSIHDSGWLGGQNTGEIVRLRFSGEMPNGIREIRAAPDGFVISFFHAVNRKRAARPESYDVTGYTRQWQGGYATPDSGRHSVHIESIDVADDARSVRLHVDALRAGYVYDIGCEPTLAGDGKELWPQTGHYTMNRVPTAGDAE